MRYPSRWRTPRWRGYRRITEFIATWRAASDMRLFGTSRQLAVGPTSAISMLVGTTVAGMAAGDPARWAAIVALTALVTAALGGIAWLFALKRTGQLYQRNDFDRIQSWRGLYDRADAAPKLFGVPGGGDNFFERVWILLGQLSNTNLVVLAFGLSAIVLLVLGDRLFPGRPVALGVVVIATILTMFSGLPERGVTTVGTIPAGLPELAWPSLQFRDVDGVLPLADACFLLAYVESVSAARSLAAKHAYKINPRQELLSASARPTWRRHSFTVSPWLADFHSRR